MYEIEEAAPYKKYKRPRPEVFAIFDKMEVGQSFKIPRQDFNKVRKAAATYCKEKDYAVSIKVGYIGDDTYRVWRTA